MRSTPSWPQARRSLGIVYYIDMLRRAGPRPGPGRNLHHARLAVHGGVVRWKVGRGVKTSVRERLQAFLGTRHDLRSNCKTVFGRQEPDGVGIRTASIVLPLPDVSSRAAHADRSHSLNFGPIILSDSGVRVRHLEE